MGKLLLVDVSDTPVVLTLEERSDGRLIMRGEFARADKPTKNGRIYSRALLEREVGRLQPKIKARKWLGELDHPSDGKTLLSRASHVVVGMSLDKDGVVRGEAEILNTPAGKILGGLLKDQISVGVSSRGTGSVAPTGSGTESVGDDYALRAFDAVYDPACETAVPEVFVEDVNEDADPFTIDVLRGDFPDIVTRLEEDAYAKASEAFEKSKDEMLEAERVKLREELEDKYAQLVATSVTEAREEIAASLREEYDSDPDVAGSRGILEAIASMVSHFNKTPDQVSFEDALKAKELELSTLQVEHNRAVAVAKRAGFTLKMERMIAGNPMADTIRRLAGDVTRFESVSALEEMVTGLVADLGEVLEVAREESKSERLAGDVGRLETSLTEVRLALDEAKGKNKDLRGRMQRAVEIGEELRRRAEEAEEERDQALVVAESAEGAAELDAYKMRVSSRFTNRPQLRQMLESAESHGEVDHIAEQHGSARFRDPMLNDMAARRRKSDKGPVRTLVEGDEDESNNGGPAGNGAIFGMSKSEQARLAGI